MITRVNISLPVETYRLIKEVASKRGFSKFLAEAAEERIRSIRARKAFKEILTGPPTFIDVKDSASWIRKSRRLDEKRFKRLGI